MKKTTRKKTWKVWQAKDAEPEKPNVAPPKTWLLSLVTTVAEQWADDATPDPLILFVKGPDGKKHRVELRTHVWEAVAVEEVK
jgi:hypothetical protein